MTLGFSLRRRLVLALLLALALAGLVVWELVRMVRSSAEQRMQFTRSMVTQELEFVAVAAEGERPTLTGLRSGIAKTKDEGVALRSLPPEVEAVLRAQVASATRGERKLVEAPLSRPKSDGKHETTTYLIGVLARDDGSVAWVAYPTRPPAFVERFRLTANASASSCLAPGRSAAHRPRRRRLAWSSWAS